jgi:hypothetical protein
LEIAGMGTRRVRIANLPPEMSNSIICTAISHYGTIQSITEETWSNNYRYLVSNGIRLIVTTLKQHIPSNITISGYTALTSYDGQPQTCYGCGETDHLFPICPKCKGVTMRPMGTSNHTWAQLAAADPSKHDATEGTNNNKETITSPTKTQTV